jgi:GAG-pre-integrase domain
MNKILDQWKFYKLIAIHVITYYYKLLHLLVFIVSKRKLTLLNCKNNPIERHNIIVAYSTEEKENFTSAGNSTVKFDSDSFPIRIDNCASRTITYDANDFVSGSMYPIENKVVHGFGGTTTTITHVGTVRWRIMDDCGKVQEILIPESYYVPNGSSRLLSPQHWAQQSSTATGRKDEVTCITTQDAVTIKWDAGSSTRTIELDKSGSNVATVWTEPGYVMAYNVIRKAQEDVPSNLTFESKVIEVEHPDPYPPDTNDEGLPIETVDGPDDNYDRKYPTDVPSNIKQDNGSSSEDRESNNQTQLLRWHYKLGHISMHRIQRMASQGLLPSSIARCRVPLCQSCIYGMMTRKGWRNKGEQSTILRRAEKPGFHVSVDQIESPVPGLVGQLKGIPTRARYKVATVFVDGYSGLSYVHLQQTTNSTETLEAKHQFEGYARTYGVQIHHYHADNGKFVETVWRDDIKNQGQTMSYSGVGAHHQNGVVEKRIRDLQDLARTSLLHAASR